VMTKNVITVDEDTPVGEIASILESRRIKRVPVLRDGKLVGLVSRANLLHALMSPKREPATASGDAEIRGAIIEGLRQAGLQTHLVNLVVVNGFVRAYGFVRTKEEQQAIRVVVDNTAGISGLKDETSVSPEFSYGY